MALSFSSASPACPSAASPAKAIDLLAYVHLRNIHGSTGAGRVARQLTEHLARRDDVRLRVLADAGDHARILPLVGDPWTRFEYSLFSADTSRQQARWFALNSPRAESYWPEADIVFCTGESFVPTRRAKLAITLHDAAYFEPDAHCKDRSFWKQRLKWKLLYAKMSRHADLFHTVSQFSADRLGHYFPSIRPRIRVVHNAVTPHFFEPVCGEGRQFLIDRNLSEKPFVLVPGGLHYRKNAELIFEAFPLLREKHPELTVAVVNHSNPGYAERAKALGPNFVLLGFVEDHALRALYSAAQAVWFPSRYEGFGLPVVEAMACGAPVVASNASSLPEIAGDAALLRDPSRAAEHVEALDGILRDAALRARLSRLGRARAAGFTWTASAAKLKSFFDELL